MRACWIGVTTLLLIVALGTTSEASALDLTGAERVTEKASFSVLTARARELDGVYLLDATLQLLLGEAPQTALENGVALTIAIDIVVYRPRSWWPDEQLAELVQRYRLLYHALSGQYVLVNINSGLVGSFDDLDRALTEISQLHDLPIIDASLLESDRRYHARMQVRLDLDALPVALRPIAYFSNEWRLASRWYSWVLKP